MAEEQTEFEQGEAVFRKHVQGIAQQLIRTGSEGFQMPPLPQDVREFGDLDKPAVPIPRFEGIDPDRHGGIIGLDDNEAIIKTSPENSFMIGNRPEQERCLVTMHIESHESTTSLDILLLTRPQLEGLTGTGFSQEREVLCAPVMGNFYTALCGNAVDESRAEVQAARHAGVASGRGPIPCSGDEVFQEMFHKLRMEMRLNAPFVLRESIAILHTSNLGVEDRAVQRIVPKQNCH
jgi:hypothetical protein